MKFQTEFSDLLNLFLFSKVRELIDFIQDDDKLREERKKAKKNKDKYIGMSSDAMGMKTSSSGGSYNDWDSNKRDDRSWRKLYFNFNKKNQIY